MSGSKATRYSSTRTLALPWAVLIPSRRRRPFALARIAAASRPSALTATVPTMPMARSAGGSAANHGPCEVRTRAAARPTPTVLARATASASSLTSVIQTEVRTRSVANDRPMAPDPQPRSATSVSTSRPPRRSSSPSATSTTCSVSGRGTSTRRSTIRSRWRNPQRPSTYCSGSPSHRRRTMSSKRATRSSVAGSESASGSSAPMAPVTSSITRRASDSGDGSPADANRCAASASSCR